MRPYNRERQTTESARAYGPPARRRWLVGQKCCVPGCDEHWVQHVHVSPRGEPSGMGRKHDYTQTVPMCAWHHRELHQQGERTFERKYNLDLDMIAQATEAKWKRYEDDLAF